MRSQNRDPLAGISAEEQETMRRLLRMRPEQQKSASKPTTPKGEAQRRRREKERQQAQAGDGLLR